MLDDAALYGLAGDVVKAIVPASEADPVALLVQTLVAAGNVIGRGPYYRVEGDQHGPTPLAPAKRGELGQRRVLAARQRCLDALDGAGTSAKTEALRICRLRRARPHPFRDVLEERQGVFSTSLTADNRDRDFSERRHGLTGIETSPPISVEHH